MAGQSTFVVWDAKANLPVIIVCICKARRRNGEIIVKPTHGYEGTSHGMEGFGCDIAFKELEDLGLLQIATECVSDADGALAKVFALHHRPH